mgnify:FL=1
MTEASRCGGKIKFIMPDNWTQEQTEKLADNVLEQAKLRPPRCVKCGYEYSATLGDNEIPEKCECGGNVIQ